MSRLGTGILAGVCFVAGLALAIVVLDGCTYAKPACAVIDLADYACESVLLTMPDGGTVAVPKRELEKVGLRYLPDAGP